MSSIPKKPDLISRLALHVLVDPEWPCGRDMLTVAGAAM
jgi:hypothetical protein